MFLDLRANTLETHFWAVLRCGLRRFWHDNGVTILSFLTNLFHDTQEVKRIRNVLSDMKNINQHLTTDTVEPMLVEHECKMMVVNNQQRRRRLSKKALDQFDEYGMAPLHAACRRGQRGLVRDLLKRGANINLVDATGRTPLMYACRNVHSNLVRVSVLPFSDT